MGTILIVERDPVFGAVLEDRLHVAGHTTELLADGERVLAAAAAEPRDLLVLDLAAVPGSEGLGAIRALRQRAETRSLPVLVLSESAETVDRVAALRAGADDYLAKPCDLEELTLRTERLVAGRMMQVPALHGDLANHPLWELVQYIQQSAKSGVLMLSGKSGRGRIGTSGGRVVAAQWGELPAAEALLAIFCMKEGRFRFVSEDASAPSEQAVATAALPSIQGVLMQAAWLEDQMAKRAGHLPASGVPLAATGAAPAPVDDELASADLPLAEVHSLVSEKPGLRIYDLASRMPRAPQKVRLAVALLVEQGALVTPENQPFEAYPTTGEITSSMLIDITVSEFLKAAREAGLTAATLPFLILAEPGVWPALLRLIENMPGYQGNEPMKAFAERLKRRRGGSVTFTADLGKLSLHAQVFTSEVRAQIDSVVNACSGVLLWLDQGADEELIRGVIERLERGKGKSGGMLVASQPPALELATRLLGGTRRWRTSSHEPLSLLGVLRLLQPVKEA